MSHSVALALDEGLDTGGQRNQPALGFGAVGSALAVDHQAVGLPVEIGSFEVGKLGDSESRVKKGPDNGFLFVGVAGVGQAGCFVCGKRFAFVLVAHRGVMKGGQQPGGIEVGCRLIGSQKIWDRGAALTSTLHGFETEMLASEENLLGLMALNRELVGQAEAFDDSERVVLDMDSTESPARGQQEGSAYNGHFESVCYHPLLLFNGHGDCLVAKLRPGNVHSADVRHTPATVH